MVDCLCETVEALDNYVGKMLAEHEDTYDPAQVRDFVDLYIKTRSESQDKHLYSGARAVPLPLSIVAGPASLSWKDWHTNVASPRTV